MKNKKKFIDPLIKRKKEISNNVQYFNNIPKSGIINPIIIPKLIFEILENFLIRNRAAII